MEPVIEAGDDAEVAATAPQAPEQIRVLVFAGMHQPAVGGHHVHAGHVVRGPAPTPGQIAEAAAQGQARNAGGRDETEHGREAVQLGLAIQVAESAPRPGMSDPAVAIDPDPAHRRQVEQQRAVRHGQSGDVVTSALDAEQQLVFAREAHALHHVRGVQATGDQGGLSVDHAVPEGTRLLVSRIAGHEHRPAEPHRQIGDPVLTQVDFAAVDGFRSHGRSPEIGRAHV